jgi:hypothetical protein
MQIGIWGFYAPKNFGDDLMALIIGKELLCYGDVAVFELQDNLAEKYGFKSFDQIDDFVASSNIVVLGGGNILADSENVANWSFFKEKIDDLLFCLKKYNKSLIIISVGGDGQNISINLLAGIPELLNYERLIGVSVRLPSDLTLLQNIGFDKNNISFYPDILFHTRHLIYEDSFDKEIINSKVIGLHLPKTQVSKMLSIWLGLFSSFKFQKTINKVVVLNGFPHKSGDYIPNGCDKNPIFNCVDPLMFCKKLSECDTIISHKLHVGLVGAVAGAKFISISAHPKVHALLTFINLKDNIILKNIRDRNLFYNIIYSFYISLLIVFKMHSAKRINKDKINSLAHESKGHICFLHRCITNYLG